MNIRTMSDEQLAYYLAHSRAQYRTELDRRDQAHTAQDRTSALGPVVVICISLFCVFAFAGLWLPTLAVTGIGVAAAVIVERAHSAAKAAGERVYLARSRVLMIKDVQNARYLARRRATRQPNRASAQRHRVTATATRLDRMRMAA